MSAILNPVLWIGMTIFFGVFVIGLGIFYIILFKFTHVKEELNAFITNTPIAIFFQNNKYAHMKAITPSNGIIYDEKYGPFIVDSTYVDKKTKSIMMPFDVDMDGDRNINYKRMVNMFDKYTTNEKKMAELRIFVGNTDIDSYIDKNSNDSINNEMDVKDIKNMTSFIRFSILKNLFRNSGPHNIKSKIEKLVAERIVKISKVDAMQAIIVFGAIFGIIVMGTLILNIVGGKK